MRVPQIIQKYYVYGKYCWVLLSKSWVLFSIYWVWLSMKSDWVLLSLLESWNPWWFWDHFRRPPPFILPPGGYEAGEPQLTLPEGCVIGDVTEGCVEYWATPCALAPIKSLTMGPWGAQFPAGRAKRIVSMEWNGYIRENHDWDDLNERWFEWNLCGKWHRLFQFHKEMVV